LESLVFDLSNWDILRISRYLTLIYIRSIFWDAIRIYFDCLQK